MAERWTWLSQSVWWGRIMPDDDRARQQAMAKLQKVVGVPPLDPTAPSARRKRDFRQPVISFLVFLVTIGLVSMALSNRLTSNSFAELAQTLPGVVELMIYVSFVGLTGWCWITNLRPHRRPRPHQQQEASNASTPTNDDRR